MSLLGVLGMGRGQAEARMTETGRLYRVTATTVDPDSLETVEITVTVLADQVCRVKYPPTILVRDEMQAAQLAARQEVELHFPSRTVGVVKDLIFAVESSAADVGLVGRKYRIKGFGAAGQTTALRVPVEEVS